MSNPQNRRIAIVIIRRKNADFFVHQRLDTKRQYPGRYGLGAGGSFATGETPLQAAERELFEETGLSGTLTQLFDWDFSEDGESQHLFAFELYTERTPRHDASEWQWSGWLEPGRVAELADEGKLCPDTAALLARYVEKVQ